MTKKDFIKSLEIVPDDFEISVATTNSCFVECETEIECIEINEMLKTVYLIFDEDKLYNL